MASLKHSKSVQPESKQRKDKHEKFDPNKHVALNSDVSHKTGIYVKEERMTVYFRPGVDVEKALDKFRNRHKSINQTR